MSAKDNASPVEVEAVLQACDKAADAPADTTLDGISEAGFKAGVAAALRWVKGEGPNPLDD